VRDGQQRVGTVQVIDIRDENIPTSDTTRGITSRKPAENDRELLALLVDG